MKKVTVLLCLLSLFKLVGYSQSDFVPGYILINKQDTIFGLIDYRDDKYNSLECRFKKTEKDTVSTFSAAQIYGYRFIDSKYYVSRPIKIKGEQKTLFLEYLVEGVVDLYYYRDLKGDHYLLGKQNIPIKEISIPNDIVTIDGTSYERNIFINRNILKFYLKDCPELNYEIDHLYNPRHKTLIQLIKKYHDIHCPHDVCLIYQKKMPKFRVDIQPIVGYTGINYNGAFGNLYNIDIYSDKYSFQYGVLGYFWLPLNNEKMFFKTGLIINRVRGYEIINSTQTKYLEQSSIIIPVQIHYQFLKSNITPVISAGLNIYSTPQIPFGPFAALNLGVNAKISDKLYATLFTGIDYSGLLFFIPFSSSQIFSYSLNVGLAVKL
jgi:hypothetical protein